MTRRALALVLLVIAAVIFVSLVVPARRDRGAAEKEYALARAERHRLRVRLADLDRRTSEEQGATAADGAAAVRALRRAALQATKGLEVSGVSVSSTASEQGAIAARGQLVAEGGFVDALRLTRRLAAPSSGLLLQRVSLGVAGRAVRVEANTFILREVQ
ncbi:MAG: hypothetical protein LJF30_20345 [Acidobacteria bacterium]|nr:hypothetical protein [Acidobacteriota bacterium]